MIESKNLVPSGSTQKCAECGSARIATNNEEITFPYGIEPNTVTLKAIVPIRKCLECGEEFLDDDADVLKHEAVCAHLNILNPRQITALIEYQRLNRESFADLTKFGIATLGRWLRGINTQNPANDQYLYLLGFPDNIERLKSRPKISEIRFDAIASQPTSRPKFRVLTRTPQLESAAASFQLIS